MNADKIHQAQQKMIVKSNAEFAVVSLNRFNDIETAINPKERLRHKNLHNYN